MTDSFNVPPPIDLPKTDDSWHLHERARMAEEKLAAYRDRTAELQQEVIFLRQVVLNMSARD